MFGLVAFLAVLALALAEQIHPCADNPTRECFANYIASVSGCIPPTTTPTTDDTWNVRNIDIEMPFFRATIHRYNTVVQGIANVEDFVLFYDDVADVTVLSYNFPSVTVTGRALVDYHQPGQLDVEVDTSFRDIYTNVNITAQWKGKQITIGTAKLYSKIDSSVQDTVNYYQELIAAANADPNGIVAQVFQLFKDNPEVNLREQESPAGRQLVRPFWNNYLCTNLPADSTTTTETTLGGLISISLGIQL